jgi:catechol 2,3-dioxygenase-like lactoylglutathione lyase family enzyme
MRLRHVALVYGSERNADRFLVDVLGLAKAEPKTLSQELARAIFDVDRELRMINYTNESLQIEVFIDGAHSDTSERIEHVCLEVDDLASFLERCGRAGMDVRQVPKGGRFVTFVRDGDGNLFEIKGREDRGDRPVRGE